MTIWFHEGLPRSGKSYEAMVKHCLTAIKAGRHVVSNIKGINAEKIAEHVGKTPEEVQALLTLIPWAETPQCYKFVQNDCLLMLDEVQDFWPSVKEKLGPEITELITQHGQRGMDIILMGQSHKDCHNLWRRRIDKLIYFVQMDALGMSKRYGWTLSKQVGDGKFQKINSGTGQYEEKYFGIYKSHVDGTENKEAYQDERANLLARPIFRYGFPAFGVVVAFAIWYTIHIFSGGGLVSTAQASAGGLPASAVAPAPSVATTTLSAADAAPVVQVADAVGTSGLEFYTPPPDAIAKLFQDFRPRLAGYLYSETTKKLFGQIEFYKADDLHRQESLSFTALEELGWQVERKSYGVKVSKAEKSFEVTSWPFDNVGQVPQRVQQSGLITGKGPEEI